MSYDTPFWYEKGKCDPAEKEQGTSEYIPNLWKYKIYAATTHL